MKGERGWMGGGSEACGEEFAAGSYAAAAWQMAHAMDLGFLKPLAECFVVLAILAWTATFIGLISTMTHNILEMSRARDGVSTT